MKKLLILLLAALFILPYSAFSQRTSPPTPTATPNCIPESVIQNGVKSACELPYGCYHSCSSFNCNFDYICEEYGNPSLCKAAHIFCSNPDAGHSVALVFVCTRNEWCLIDPQTGSMAGCGPLPNIMSDRTLCRAMNRPYPCDCKYEDYHVYEDDVNYANPSYCARHRSSFNKCTNCCESTIDFHCSRKDPLADQWADDCIQSCKNYHGDHPYSPRPTATPRCTPTKTPSPVPTNTPTTPTGRTGR